MPPMPERKHNLPTMFSRLDDQITGDVAEAIVIHLRSHGRLYLRGEWSTDNRSVTAISLRRPFDQVMAWRPLAARPYSRQLRG